MSSFLCAKHTELSVGDWKLLLDVLDNFSSVIVLFIPFVGFVAGYVIECFMSIFEHLFYLIGGRRPSKNILKGSSIYVLHNLEQINMDLLNNEALTNRNCKIALQKAKQQIDRAKCLDFLYASILARNLFGSQIMILIFLVIQFGWMSKSVLYATILALLFLVYWIHKNHVYVKYIFSEYAKTYITGCSDETEPA